jgi:hypothetical protein
MLISIETYTEGKNKWEIKRDSEDNKWSIFKNGKKLKTSKFFEVIAEEVPCYKGVYKN